MNGSLKDFSKIESKLPVRDRGEWVSLGHWRDAFPEDNSEFTTIVASMAHNLPLFVAGQNEGGRLRGSPQPVLPDQ